MVVIFCIVRMGSSGNHFIVMEWHEADYLEEKIRDIEERGLYLVHSTHCQ